jgi:hypothetical protein
MEAMAQKVRQGQQVQPVQLVLLEIKVQQAHKGQQVPQALKGKKAR